MKTPTYKVTYTKKIGGESSILVKASSAETALANARNVCVTGSDFRDPVLTEEAYTKPRKQGFAGRQ